MKPYNTIITITYNLAEGMIMVLRTGTSLPFIQYNVYCALRTELHAVLCTKEELQTAKRTRGSAERYSRNV